ncbi:MAG: hypothetical protein SFU91_01985 [Chloroherpetonaceae bacterium]|nr:hypothetical protein [Chloroherpetonaceae bacterium]
MNESLWRGRKQKSPPERKGLEDETFSSDTRRFRLKLSFAQLNTVSEDIGSIDFWRI